MSEGVEARTPLLVAGGVSVAYGRITVVEDVSLDVPQGAAIGLIGRNGAGKTTFLKAVMGLLPLRAGSVSFAGTALSGRPAWARCPLGIGYVPQGRLVFPRLSVEDNLALGAMATKASYSERSSFVLDLFPILKDLLQRRAGSLSGGQQQVLAIGRALMSNPRLLILDEPTEGIQPSIIIDIAEKLAYLSRELQLSLLVVEQRLDFLAQVVTHAAIMDRGRLVDELPCQDLVDDHALQREYLGV